MKKIYVILTVFMITAANIFAMNSAGVSDSNNWLDEHPALLAVDNQPNSYAQLLAAEGGGWIAVDLEDEQRIMGYRIDATIPEGAWLSLSYDDDGILKRIPASYITELDGETTVMFQEEQIVAESISIMLDGPDSSDIRIFEFELLARDVSGFKRKAELVLTDENGEFPYYYDSGFLVDGYAGTSWWGVSTGGGYNSSSRGGDNRYGSNDNRSIGRSRGHVRNGYGYGFEIEQNGYSNWGFDFGGGWNHYQRQIYAEFETVEPGAYDSFSYYLSSPAWGTLTVTAITENGEIKIGDFPMHDSVGWHTAGLDEIDAEISGIRVSVTGSYGTMGGIGEIELWKSDDYKCAEWESLKGFSNEGESVFSIYSIDEEDIKDRELVVAIDSDEAPATLPVKVNGRNLYNYNSETTGSISLYRIALDENVLWDGNNFVSIEAEEGQRILSATIGEASQNEFVIEKELSGYEKKIELDGAYNIHQLVIVSETDADYNLRIEGGWTDEYIDDYEGDDRIRVYNFEEPQIIERIRIYGEDGRYSVSVKGSSADYGTYIKVLPEQDYVVNSDNVYLHGITDAASSDTIKVNGQVANKLGNYFWVSLSRLGINSGGIFEVEVTIERGWHRTISSYKAEYLYEVDSNMLRLDESEEIVYTSDPVYTVSGTVERSWFFNPDLYINDKKVGMSGRSFNHSVNLSDGLNIISVELKNGMFRQTIALQYLYVYKYSGNLGITIDRPLDGSYVSSDRVVVSGNIENAVDLTSVTVNGVEASVDGSSFSAEVAVESETQNIVVNATDSVIGNAGKSITIYRDMTAPVISEVFPENGHWIAAHSIRIKGYVTDQSRSQVYVNGYLAVQNDGYFEADTSLVEGSNTISIVARDLAGNENHLPPFIVNSDTTAPENIAVSADISGWTNNNRPTIIFSADDAGIGVDYYEISVAGNAFIEQESPFQTSIIEDGIKEIAVRAIDKLGNYADESITVKIDTLPPDTPSSFRAIPGNANVMLAWSEDDEETESYVVSMVDGLDRRSVEIDRDSAVIDENTETGFFEIDYSEVSAFNAYELENGEEYEFSIVAIDRAGNESFEKIVEVSCGFAAEEYVEDELTIVEYESVKLLIPPESLSDDVEAIEIYETESEDMEELATFPIISPIYSFTGITSSGESIEHVDFETDYVCKLDFDEELVPDGFPEQNLGVYYYDTGWSKWFKVEDTVVDTENNQIMFSTNHFTDFSVQPTVIEDLSAQELAAIEFEPFSKNTKHEELSVSMQGGGVSTSMTEFVLPGKNGFDLPIRRTYDTSTAKGDARGISANISISLGDILSGDVAADLLMQLVDEVGTQNLNSVKSYFQNNGDYSYAIGQGWRLNFPYVRSSNSSVLIRTSSGAFYDMKAMDIDESKSGDIAIGRKLYLENHEREDFTLEVIQTKDPIQFSTSKTKYAAKVITSWTTLYSVLSEKDGKKYTFDSFGRCTSIEDPNGNSIRFHYNLALQLDYIEDSMGRKIYFEYENISEEIFCVPQIKRIYVENSSGEIIKDVDYKYLPGGAFGLQSSLPLLNIATDVNGRTYSYGYDNIWLTSGEVGLKINIAALIADVVGAIFGVSPTEMEGYLSEIGISAATVSSSAQAMWTFPMNEVSGYGIRNNSVVYKKETLEFFEVDAADYLLGAIPTAIEGSTGIQERSFVNTLTRRNQTINKVINESYSFNVEYAGEKQFYVSSSSLDDGKKKEIYTYNCIEKERMKFSTWSDWVTNIVVGTGFTERPFYFEYLPFETEKKIYNSSTGELIETTTTEWNEEHLQPSMKNIARGSGNYVKTQYTYDDWGNIKKDVVTEQNISGSITRTNYRLYANVENNAPNVSGWQASPYSYRTFADEIYDRVYRQLTVLNDGVSGTRYINVSNEYDLKGNKTGGAIFDDGSWHKTAYQVNTAGEITRITNPSTHVTDIDYDYDSYDDYYVIKQTQNNVEQGDDSKLTVTTSTVYDRYTGLPVWTKDGRGYVTYTEYDDVGRKTLIQLPDDDDNTGWDPLSDDTPSFRGNNPKTIISYNDSAKTIRITNPEGAVTDYAYHDLGNITQKVLNNRYGATSISGGDVDFSVNEQIITTFGYDAYNNITSVRDPRGYTTTYSYDVLNQPTSEVYPSVDGKSYTKTYEYDYSSRKRTIINENGEKTMEYSDAGENVLQRMEYDNNSLERVTYFYYDAAGKLVKSVDGKEGETVYSYNARNQEISRTMPEADFSDGNTTYTATPKLVTIYNEDGYKKSETTYRNTISSLIEYETNGLGQIIKTKAHYTDMEGNINLSETKSIYDPSGNEVETIDPRGNSVTRNFTARGKLSDEIDALGNTLSYEYDNLDRQTGMTDQRGNSVNYDGDFTIEYAYDDLDRLTTGRLPKHRGISVKPEINLVYDLRGNLLYRLEADGGINSFVYDARNRQTRSTRSASDSSTTYRTTMSYDGVGNMLSLTEPGTGTVEYEYDGLNRLRRETYTDGGERYYSYDDNNNLEFEDYPNGYRSYYSYNAVNQLIKKTDQLDGVSEYRYDEAGNLTWHKDENGVIRESVYDELNRLVKETDGRGGTSTYAYDEAGNLVNKTDPNGTTVTNTYGATNLLNSSSYINGGESNYISYAYDEGGVITSVTDGGITNTYNTENGVYIPDPYGLIFNDTMNIGGNSKTVAYSYDEKNRLSSLTMPSGENHSYDYNGLDQITGLPEYINGQLSYADNTYLAGYTFLNDVTLDRTYDDKRRVTDINYTSPAETEALDEYSLSYDLSDNITRKNGDYFSYDGKDRLISGSLAGDSAAMPYDYEGESDEMDAQPDIMGTKEMQLISGDDLSLDWGAKSLGIDLKYGYRVSEITLYPTSTTTRLDADKIEIYTSLYNMDSQYGEPLGFSYTEENDGEITIKLNEVSFARYIKIHTHYNEMDADGNYLSEDSEFSLDAVEPYKVVLMSAGRNEFYNYDDEDNRTKLTYVTTDFETYNYTYYDNSDLIKTDGTYGYKYDANGNMTVKGSIYTEEGNDLTILKVEEYREYEYDLLNRMTGVSKWDEEAGDMELIKSYRYNGANYRVLSTDSEGDSTYYTFDTNGQMIEKTTVEGTEETTRDYIYLGTRVIAHVEDGETRYYGTDHIGSTSMMTDESGAVVWSGEVTPFADSESTSDDSEHVLYTGKELDEATGLYYYNARWYDPNLGRFTTEDPIRDGLNWYAYANNNPLKFVDPTGLRVTEKPSDEVTMTIDKNNSGKYEYDNGKYTNKNGSIDKNTNDDNLTENIIDKKAKAASDVNDRLSYEQAYTVQEQEYYSQISTYRNYSNITFAAGLEVVGCNPVQTISNFFNNGSKKPDSFELSFGIYLGINTNSSKSGLYGSIGYGNGSPQFGYSGKLGVYNTSPEKALKGKSLETGTSVGPVEGALILDNNSNPYGVEITIGNSLLPFDAGSYEVISNIF